jgi:hypothetical protein
MSNSFFEFCEDFLYGRGACGDGRGAALRAVKYNGSAFGETLSNRSFDCAQDDEDCAQDDGDCAQDDGDCAQDDGDCAQDDGDCAQDDADCAQGDSCCAQGDGEARSAMLVSPGKGGFCAGRRAKGRVSASWSDL